MSIAANAAASNWAAVLLFVSPLLYIAGAVVYDAIKTRKREDDE